MISIVGPTELSLPTVQECIAKLGIMSNSDDRGGFSWIEVLHDNTAVAISDSWANANPKSPDVLRTRFDMALWLELLFVIDRCSGWENLPHSERARLIGEHLRTRSRVVVADGDRNFM